MDASKDARSDREGAVAEVRREGPRTSPEAARPTDPDPWWSALLGGLADSGAAAAPDVA
jgi:hypothetical protein